MASIDDRWFRRVNRRLVPTARNGHGMRWRVRYKTPAGQERGKSFARKADAEKFKATTEADLIRGKWTDPASGRVMLADYARQWLAAHAGEPTTIDQLRSRIEAHIIPGLGHVRLVDLRPSQIQAFITGLPLAPGTVRVVLTTLSSILNAAVDDEILSTNPTRKASVKAPTVVRTKREFWSAELVAAIRGGLPERYRVLCDLGGGCGLRMGEIFGLDVRAVEMLPHILHVRQQLRLVNGSAVLALPKNHKERSIPLPEPVAQALAAHLAAFPAVEVSLPWRTPDGPKRTVRLVMSGGPPPRPVHRNTFNSGPWRAAVRQAGLTPSRETGTHQLRHRYASVLVAAGVDVRTVAEYLGHQDGGALLLRTYSHLLPSAPDRVRKAIEAALANEPEVVKDLKDNVE